MEDDNKPVEKTEAKDAEPEALAETVSKEETSFVGPKGDMGEPGNIESTEPKEKNKEKTMDKDLPNQTKNAATQLQHDAERAEKGLALPSQEANITTDYLKSKGAVLEFARISKACGGDPAETQMRWKEHLAAKGVTITGQDSFYPTAIEQVMFKAWHDAVGALATFRRTRAKMTRFYAMTTTSRAAGHKKGDKKGDQDVVAIPRTANLRTVFKKLPLDWIDIVNDDSGELYRFRTRELFDRVLSEIVRGAIIGDGRTAPATGQPDLRVFADGEGLYSMAADINNSGTAGSFASAVATLIANDATDDTYAKIIKTLGKVRIEEGSGRQRVLVVPEGTMAEMLLEKNENGGRLYPAGTDFREVFNVRDIIEFPAEDMAAVNLDVIAYATDAYTLGGPDATVRNWFDGNENKDYMMVEQPVLGSLEGYHVAAGYASKA